MITVGSFNITDEKIKAFYFTDEEVQGNENQNGYFVENIVDEIKENYTLEVHNLNEAEKNSLYAELRKKWLLKTKVTIPEYTAGALTASTIDLYVDYKASKPVQNDLRSYEISIKLWKITPAEDIAI